jgi:RNA polymerase primary sigma factor
VDQAGNNKKPGRSGKGDKNPHSYAQYHSKVLLHREAAHPELSRDPGLDEIADRLNMSRQKLIKVMEFSQSTASLDSVMDGDNSTSLSELIRDDSTVDPYSEVFKTTLKEVLDCVLQGLSARENTILKLRYGLSGESTHTLEETGKVLGITRERVRQIQERALEKLREKDELSECGG